MDESQSECICNQNKRSYCILPNTHSDKICIHTSLSSTFCITMPSVGTMYGYQAVDFMTDFLFHMLLDSVDYCMANVFCFIFIMKKVYAFE